MTSSTLWMLLAIDMVGLVLSEKLSARVGLVLCHSLLCVRTMAATNGCPKADHGGEHGGNLGRQGEGEAVLAVGEFHHGVELAKVGRWWSQKRTTFEGKHYSVSDIAMAAPLADGDPPRILIGGGGKRVLSIAGRYADIVGINPSMVEGKVTGDTARDLTPDRVREKIDWVRESASAAGRDPDSLEFNSLVFVVAMTDEPSGMREALAKNSGMSVAEVADCPLFLTGSASEICDRLAKRREETGISYIAIQGDDPDRLERFAAEVVAPLAGH